MISTSYANGLRAALRQAPKVILVGEMRDRETVKIALSAAETGHLVLSTLHTINAGETINRILGMFETGRAGADPHPPGRFAALGRQPAAGAPRSAAAVTPCSKSWAPTCAPRKPSAWAKAKAKPFTKSSRPAIPFGWRTFDHACLEAYEQGLITEETALLYCTKRSVVSRGIDNIKKARGEIDSTPSARCA